MTLLSSSQFMSCAAQGADWREASKTVLEELGEEKPAQQGYNFGFLFVSDALAEDAQSILNLFKSVLKIENWVGGIGLGVCAGGQSFIDGPAVSVMLGKFEPESFCIFPPINLEPEKAKAIMVPWLEAYDPMLVFVCGDPMSEEDPALLLHNLDMACNGFMVGGLTSSRNSHAQFAKDFYQGGLCGALFSDNVPVASTLSQGCDTIGGVHTITRCDGHEILELDGQKAVEVFEHDLRAMAIKKLDVDPDQVLIDEEVLDNPDSMPEEFQSLIQGEVHAALAISESDGQDYLVRNIIGINPDDGAMMISQHVFHGERLMFVHRDHESVYRDLSANLIDLRKRVQEEYGEFAPKGALYISCAARAYNEFDDQQKNEITLIKEIIGDVPLTGFYAGGEINKGRLYGYTGILTLFL
ncbi:MAG: FIST C-terminal domain-containing protein [Alphaproteobacteria bacterium]|nr:FIST C-terminal domain-containing protein [Alphaproteobacteria bacterium]